MTPTVARLQEVAKEADESEGRSIFFADIYIHTCTHKYKTCIYIYMGYMGNGISPPAFCDISKSHELKQFRVKGLGYMSLGFRLPNFPISQIVLPHLGWGLLGNWEIGKLGSMYL